MLQDVADQLEVAVVVLDHEDPSPRSCRRPRPSRPSRRAARPRASAVEHVVPAHRFDEVRGRAQRHRLRRARPGPTRRPPALAATRDPPSAPRSTSQPSMPGSRMSRTTAAGRSPAYGGQAVEPVAGHATTGSRCPRGRRVSRSTELGSSSTTSTTGPRRPSWPAASGRRPARPERERKPKVLPAPTSLSSHDLARRAARRCAGTASGPARCPRSGSRTGQPCWKESKMRSGPSARDADRRCPTTVHLELVAVDGGATRHRARPPG